MLAHLFKRCAMAFEQKEQYDIRDLVDIIRILREPGGCPWDREQTHTSIRKNLIEETYEVAEAIDLGDAALLREELGDLLLQIILHARMEEESGSFDFAAVCDGICKKLIYRHPHVFGDVTAAGTDDVLRRWEALKNIEKGRETAADRLNSVPGSLPALMRCTKVQKRADDFGFCYANAERALQDLESEIAELRQALATGTDIKAEAGDILFSAANAARLAGADAEEALNGSTDRFTARVALMEELAAQQDRALAALSDEERDTLWKEAKRRLKNGPGRP